MPLTSLAVDALGVVTICLVVLLVLFGLFCIIYTLYFRACIQSSRFVRLGYFNGPWVVRIIFVAFGICWGVGEVIRSSFFRGGKIFHPPSQRWQKNMCKLYILSNLGFTEPCLFLIMSFLLRASLKWRDSEIINRKWNIRITGYVLLYCLPVFVLDLLVVLVAPELRHRTVLKKLPKKFTSTFHNLTVSGRPAIACTYPMLCTIFHGLFAIILTCYLLLLGRRLVVSVINKRLQRRIYILITLVSGFLPLRVLLLGFSVLAWKEHFLFEALAFSGFLVLLSCVVVGIFMLAYLPVADSLALNRGGWAGLRVLETGEGQPYPSEDHSASLSLVVANQSHVETSTAISFGRNSDSSTKQGSVSFRTLIKDEASTGLNEEEMTTCSPGFRLLSASSPGSPSAPMVLRSS